jgi:hypothetical protein
MSRLLALSPSQLASVNVFVRRVAPQRSNKHQTPAPHDELQATSFPHCLWIFGLSRESARTSTASFLSCVKTSVMSLLYLSYSISTLSRICLFRQSPLILSNCCSISICHLSLFNHHNTWPASSFPYCQGIHIHISTV